MTALQLLIGAFTLITNAFFVGAEFAMISVRRSQIEPAARKGNLRAKTVLWGLEHLSAMMATAQLGIAVSSSSSARSPNPPSPTCWNPRSTRSASPKR